MEGEPKSGGVVGERDQNTIAQKGNVAISVIPGQIVRGNRFNNFRLEENLVAR